LNKLKSVIKFLTEDASKIPWLEQLFDRLNKEVFDGELIRNFPVIFREMKNKVAHVIQQQTGRNTYKTLELAFSKNYHFSDAQYQKIMLHEMIHVWELQNGIDSDHGGAFYRQLDRIKALGYEVNRSESPGELEVSDTIKGRKNSYTVVQIVDTKKGNVFLLLKKFDPAIEQSVYDIINRHARAYGKQTIRVFRNVSEPVFDKMKFAVSVNGAFARQYVEEPEHTSALSNYEYEEKSFPTENK